MGLQVLHVAHPFRDEPGVHPLDVCREMFQIRRRKAGEIPPGLQLLVEVVQGGEEVREALVLEDGRIPDEPEEEVIVASEEAAEGLKVDPAGPDAPTGASPCRPSPPGKGRSRPRKSPLAVTGWRRSPGRTGRRGRGGASRGW
jgi:hypothetical protein